MVTVLPLPAGASASFTRAPEVASWRTISAWSGPSWTLVATASSNARSTVSLATTRKSRPAASARMRPLYSADFHPSAGYQHPGE